MRANHASAPTAAAAITVTRKPSLTARPTFARTTSANTRPATRRRAKAPRSAKPVRRCPARRWAAPGTSADSPVHPMTEAVVGVLA